MAGPVFYNSQQYVVMPTTSSQIMPIGQSQVSSPTYADPQVNLAMNGPLNYGQSFSGNIQPHGGKKVSLNVVQYAEGNSSSGTSPIATLGASPTPGNWLVGVFASYNSTGVSLAAGWQWMWNTNPNPSGNPQTGVVVYRVEFGDGRSWAPFINTAPQDCYLDLWEISGPYPQATYVQNTFQASGTNPPTITTGSFTPSNSGSLALLSGYCRGRNFNGAPSTPSGWTQDTAMVQLNTFNPGSEAIAYHSTVTPNNPLSATTLTWGSQGTDVAAANVVVLEPQAPLYPQIVQPPILGTGQFAAGSNISLTFPVLPAIGNTIVVIAMARSTTFTALSGWTSAGSAVDTMGMMVLTRTVAAGDTTTITPVSTNSNSAYYLYAYEVRNVNSVSAQFTESAAANPATVTATSYTPSSAGGLVLYGVGFPLSNETLTSIPSGLAIQGLDHSQTNNASTVYTFSTTNLGTTAYAPTFTWSGGASGVSDVAAAELSITAGGLGGGDTFSGTFSLSTNHLSPAGVSFAGGLSNTIGKAINAALSFVGNLANLYTPGSNHYQQALTAILSFTGAENNATSHGMTAGVSFTGTATKALSRAYNASLTFTGSVGHMIGHFLAGSLGFTGGQTKRSSVSRQGGLGFLGAVSTLRLKLLALTGGLSFTGGQSRTTGKVASAFLSFSGGQQKAASKSNVGNLTFAGGLAKAIRVVPFLATLTFAGSVLPVLSVTGSEIVIAPLADYVLKVIAGSKMDAKPITLQATFLPKVISATTLASKVITPLATIIQKIIL